MISRSMKNIYIHIAKLVSPPSGLVLATVTGVRGSTPQKPGSSALLGNNILISGTVGGGVVENKVREYAVECSQSKRSAFLNFTLGNDISMKEEAICGGNISILVDADPLKHLRIFREMEQCIADGGRGVLITEVKGSVRHDVTIERYWISNTARQSLPDHFKGSIGEEVNKILSSSVNSEPRQMDISFPGEQQSLIYFLEPINPLPRLIIAGAGHIGKALSHLGILLGFEVTVIDDRSEYANADNLPDADHIIVKDIGEAMQNIRKDAETYIAIVTRGHANDASALKPCIGSHAAYTGMIGSKSKVAVMREEFIRNKWSDEEQWQKIYTPIGIDIGSQTVEEIAVSIAAQLVLVRSSRGKG